MNVSVFWAWTSAWTSTFPPPLQNTKIYWQLVGLRGPQLYEYIYIYIYVYNVPEKCATEAGNSLGTGCLGRWRGAKLNMGSGFRDDFILYVSPYMLVIWYCGGLWDERKSNYDFHTLVGVLAAQGPKETSKTIKTHSTNYEVWALGSKAVQRGPGRPKLMCEITFVIFWVSTSCLFMPRALDIRISGLTTI